MSTDLFWFNDEQWSKVEPHLPTNQRGPERHDDRRILSGIMHVQKVGCRWKDCRAEYGPHKTIYNRFARWSERGIRQNIFATIAACSGTPGVSLGPAPWHTTPTREPRRAQDDPIWRELRMPREPDRAAAQAKQPAEKYGDAPLSLGPAFQISQAILNSQSCMCNFEPAT